MAHISGLLLIECPASALNNAGQFLEMENPNRYENWTAVKKVRTKQGVFPYVSAQAFRSWLRESLRTVEGWTASPTFREEKIAYTDANPIEYAEDDVFGYMRAPGGGKEAVRALKERWGQSKLTDQEVGKGEKFVALTRMSPFKTSTLISIAPLQKSSIGYDYGNMARTEAPEYPNPVPFEHEFYRTTLVGLFSLDLRMLGRFYCVERTGYRHLDAVRKRLAEDRGLKSYDGGKAFELSIEERKKRLMRLFEGLARLTGGAKLALHYTDVSPRLLMMAVAKGGNHLFGTTVGANVRGEPVVNLKALEEAERVFKNDLLSRFYVGLTQGFLDEQRPELLKTLTQWRDELFKEIPHPVEEIRAFNQDLESKSEEWLA